MQLETLLTSRHSLAAVPCKPDTVDHCEQGVGRYNGRSPAGSSGKHHCSTSRTERSGGHHAAHAGRRGVPGAASTTLAPLDLWVHISMVWCMSRRLSYHHGFADDRRPSMHRLLFNSGRAHLGLVDLHGFALHDVLGVVDLGLDDHLVQLLLVRVHLRVLHRTACYVTGNDVWRCRCVQHLWLQLGVITVLPPTCFTCITVTFSL